MLNNSIRSHGKLNLQLVSIKEVLHAYEVKKLDDSASTNNFYTRLTQKLPRSLIYRSRSVPEAYRHVANNANKS